MKKITLESKELKKVIQNLHLEDMSLSEKGQQKVLEIINMNTPTTSSLIKGLLRHGEI